jgi:PAS domain S-box-containing protein
VVLTAACFLIFGDPGLIPVRLHVLAFAVLPFVMWAAIRFGVMGAGLSVLLIATIATVETALGSGPFAISTPFTNAVLLDAFFAVLSVTGITLASVIAEREQAQREREQGVREQGALEARLEAEQAVRASEERLRLAQQAAHIGTFDWNIQTGVGTWTPELEAMHGLPPGGFGGAQTDWENLVHPDDLQEVLQLVEEALKTGQPMTGEWRVVWPDRSVHWIAGRWQVLMNESGEPLRMVGVNVDVTERKRAETALLKVNHTLEEQTVVLQSREELLKIFVKNVPVGVAMLDRDMRYLQVSDRWCADYSVDSTQVLGRSHYEVFPDVPQRWKEMHRRALEGETLRVDEDRWDREGGTTAWVRWEIRPWRTPSGVVGGILIFAEDITRRKQMEEAISGVSGRLIEAQERERGRIARDLHDDICQQLALVSIGLEQVQRTLPDSVSEHRSHVGDLRKRIMDISTDVQMMSHELHSAKLSYLGMAGAMKGLCREFGEHHKFEIDFESRDLPRQLPPDVSLCLFRVLQEALHNAAKHSGVKRFEVQLWGTSGDVHLTISDLGSGFDTESAMKGRGLGITSMQERLKLVKGELTINSQPKRGTTIHARVPLDLESQSALATG